MNSTFSLTRTTPEGRHALGFGVILIVMGVMILGGLYVLQVIRLPQKKDPTVKVVTPSSQSTRRGAGSPIEQPLLLKDQLPETHRRPSKSLEDLYRKYGQEQGTNQAATANTEKKTKTATTGLGDWIPRVDPKRMPALHSPNGKLQLPFGWHLMGTANQGPNHKVNVRVNTIIDPQGKEYPITAMVLSLEQEPGFDGYATESPLMLELLPLASTTVKTFMDALKDVTTQQSVIPTGNTTVVGSQQTYALNAKSKLLDGTAQVLSGIMADKAKELNKLYPQGTIVPRGTLGWALLTVPLDLTLGKEGGSTEFLDKHDANPAPNIITLSQQQGTTYSAGPMPATETGTTPYLPTMQLPPGVPATPNLSGVQALPPSASATKPLE